MRLSDVVKRIGNKYEEQNEDYLKVDGAILVKKENVNKLENTVTTVYSFGDGTCLAFVNFCGLASKIFDKIDLIFKLSL